MSPTPQERRRHARHLIRPRLYVALNGESSGGILNDVSEGGMSLDILGPRPASNDVVLNFDLSEIGQHFEAKGRVTWSSRAVNESRVGLRFVDLSETSRVQIKNWLAKKVSPPEISQNVAVQDWARDGAPAQYQARQQQTETALTPPWEKAARSGRAAVATTGALTDTDLPVGKARDTYRNSTVAAETAGTSQVPPERTPQERNDRLVNGIRSSIAQHAADPDRLPPTGTEPKRARFDREAFQKWILAAVMVFVLILAVAAARWIYTSPTLDKVALPTSVRDAVGSIFGRPTDTSKPAEGSSNPTGTKTGRPSHKEAKVPGRNQMPPEGTTAQVQKTPAKQFEMQDAQNGHPFLPTKSIAPPPAPVKPGATDTAQVSGGQPGSGSLAQETGGSKVGLVSVQPSAQVPESKVLPEYPVIALLKNIQGRVVIGAVIGKDGALQNVHLVGPPSILSAPVLEAVKKWHYQPRLQNGVPVEVETQITIDFEINAK
jgi:TonB family protein